MVYSPEPSPPLSDSDTTHNPALIRRALRSIGNPPPPRTKPSMRLREACRCAPQLTQLRSEVAQLTHAVNELTSIVHARLLFPHLSLAEALAGATDVTYDHVRPPKRPRSDSALYLPDIPDGFSDSTAHSLAFRRRSGATTTEQECRRAVKKLPNPDPGLGARGDTIVLEPDAKRRRPRARRTRTTPPKVVTTRGDAAKRMRTTRSGRVARK